LIVDQM